MNDIFHRIAKKTSDLIGTPQTFILSLMVISIWALSGPYFKFNDTWQLFINTSTTIITFLTVFLIQNTQNRDSKALHLKLDELIRSSRAARNKLIDLEDFTDDEMSKVHDEFKKINMSRKERKANGVL